MKRFTNKYKNDNIRSGLFLIETSDDKWPKENTMGKLNYNCLTKFSSNSFYGKLDEDTHKSCL